MSKKKDKQKSPRQLKKIFTEKLGTIDSFRKETSTRGDLFLTIIIVVALIFFSSFYKFVLVNADALKAFIEAEATVIGFFGVIAAYLLTSIDSRIDRLESEKHEYEAKLESATTTSFQDAKPTPSSIELWRRKIANLEDRLDGVQNKKESLAYEASIIGLGLIVSLIADIALLGLQSVYVVSSTKFLFLLQILASIAATIPIIAQFCLANLFAVINLHL